MKRTVTVFFVLLLLLPLFSLTAFAAAPPDNGGNLGSFLLDGLTSLFIPREDYFPELQDKLYTAFQAKFGAIVSVVTYLQDRLSNLRAYRGDLFVMKFPSDHLFGGRNLDLMEGAEGITELIRGGLSGFVVICTVVFAYKKVLAMINS